VQRLQDDDARTAGLADYKAKMLEERKAFKRQNDLERHRVMESMAKMRKNPGSAIKDSMASGGHGNSTSLSVP